MFFTYKSVDGVPSIAESNFINTIPGESSEYPIISGLEAYEKLKKGDAYILYERESGNIDITDVNLGYYVGPDQEYFLPVIVFSGSGFTAYVNALFSQ